MTTTTYVATAFSVDDFGPYKGLHSPSARWNGWLMPLFTVDVVREIADDLAREQALVGLHPEETVTITVDADGVWEHQGPSEGYADPRGMRVEPVSIGGVDYYGIGDGFCWTEWTDMCCECGGEFLVSEMTDLTRPGIDPAWVMVCHDCESANA